MAYDTLIDKAKEIAQRKSLADHIRAKGGTTAPLTWGKGYEDAVDAITGAPKDPHTLLLLHCDSLTDSSKYNVPLSNNGVTISTTQSKFGGKSLYFDGNAWINFPQEYAPYKDKDFTIDWWEYCTTSDVNHQSRYFSSDAGGPSDTLGLLLGHLGKQAYCGNGWSMVNGAEMFNIVQNQWVHWATVRHGNVLLTFRNGKKFAQTSIVGSIPYDTKTMHCIGGWRYSPGQKWIGYMDEFRISDIARWTTDFTPPNAPYDNTQACKPEQEKTVNAIKNGPVVVTPDNGKVLSKATVNVNVPSDKKPEQTKTVDITSNGDVTITPDVGKVLSSVLAKVNVSGGGAVPVLMGYKASFPAENPTLSVSVTLEANKGNMVLALAFSRVECRFSEDFTIVDSFTISSSTTSQTLYILYKKILSDEPVTLTLTNSSSSRCAVILMNFFAAGTPKCDFEVTGQENLKIRKKEGTSCVVVGTSTGSGVNFLHSCYRTFGTDRLKALYDYSIATDYIYGATSSSNFPRLVAYIEIPVDEGASISENSPSPLSLYERESQMMREAEDNYRKGVNDA